MGEGVTVGPADLLDWSDPHVVESMLRELMTNPRYLFSSPVDEVVPAYRYGTYAVWSGDALEYVGRAGRNMGSEDSSKRQGLLSRLNSHATGIRSGDQFHIYVFDFEVLPTLTPEQIQDVRDRRLFLDDLTRDYIQDNLTYSFIITPDYETAGRVEDRARAGEWDAGVPRLNPLGPRRRRIR
jgi:hypothetical protein